MTHYSFFRALAKIEKSLVKIPTNLKKVSPQLQFKYQNYKSL